MAATIDREPRIWWTEEQGNQTRCIACGRQPFPYEPRRACPHHCATCAAAALPPAPYTAGFAADKGPRRVHADAAAVYRDPATGRQAFAVADGVGDEYDAEEAARLAVWAATAAATAAGAAGGLHQARDIWDRRYADAPPGQAGHAVVVLAVPFDAAHGGGWDLAWCGDARAYEYQDGTLTQLTTDHTEAERMRARGIPAEWIGPQSENRVTATIGYGEIASVRTLAPTGRLLLCSDGVYGKLSAATIARGLRIFTDPRAAARRLVRAARRQGSTDNATALVIDPPSADPGRPAALAP